MAYPIYFTPVQHPDTGHFLVDGGMMHNYPMDLLTEQEQKETWGVAFVQEPPTAPPVNDFMDFLFQLIATSYVPVYRRTVKSYKAHTILVDCHHITSLQFEMEASERQTIIQMGMEAALAFCKANPPSGHSRRHSVH